MVHLRVPSTLRCRALVVAAMRVGCDEAAARLGRPIPLPFVDALVTAVGEAFNNIVIHGYSYEPDGEVEIDMTLDDERDGVSVFLRDAGRSFDPEAVPEVDLGALPENGMGWFLIRRLVDVVRYRSGEPDGLSNELVLEKRFEG